MTKIYYPHNKAHQHQQWRRTMQYNPATNKMHDLNIFITTATMHATTPHQSLTTKRKEFQTAETTHYSILFLPSSM
jgi:hypothetical protein